MVDLKSKLIHLDNNLKKPLKISIVVILFLASHILGLLIGSNYQAEKYQLKNSPKEEEEGAVLIEEKVTGINFQSATSLCSQHITDSSLKLSTDFQTHSNNEYMLKLKYPSNLKLIYFKDINGENYSNVFSLKNAAELEYIRKVESEHAEYASRGETAPGRGAPKAEITFLVTTTPNKNVIGFTWLLLTHEDEMMITKSVKKCDILDIGGNKGIIGYGIGTSGGDRDILLVKLKDKEDYISISINSEVNEKTKILDTLIANMSF